MQGETGDEPTLRGAWTWILETDRLPSWLRSLVGQALGEHLSQAFVQVVQPIEQPVFQLPARLAAGGVLPQVPELVGVGGAEELAAEIGRFAERSGRSVAAVRAQVEQDNGLTRLRTGLRREKTVDLLLGNAAITTA